MENPNAKNNNNNNNNNVCLRRHHTTMSSSSLLLQRRYSNNNNNKSTSLRCANNSSTSCSGSSAHRLSMKSNPYVGVFRHAPPEESSSSSLIPMTTTTTTTWMKWSNPHFQHSWSPVNQEYHPINIKPTAPSSSSSLLCNYRQEFPKYVHFPKTLGTMKRSPYVGWFRHAPPSTFPTQQHASLLSSTKHNAWGRNDWHNYYSSNTLSSSSFPTKLQQHIRFLHCQLQLQQQQLLQRKNPLSMADLQISGVLKGGCDHNNNAVEHYNHYYTSSSSRFASHAYSYPHEWDPPESSTLQAFKRLATWLFHSIVTIPVIPDEAALAGHDQAKDDNNNNKNEPEMETTTTTPTALHANQSRPPRRNDKEASPSSCCSSSSSSSSSSSGDEEHNDDDDDGDDHSSLPSSELPGNLLDLSELDIPSSEFLQQGSVSSLAEAYHFHQAMVQELEGGGEHSSSSLLYFNDDDDDDARSYPPPGANRLDYIITQMDIVRMARNAARHLDVESIYNLPIITYHAKPKRRRQQQQQLPSNSNSTADLKPNTDTKNTTTSTMLRAPSHLEESTDDTPMEQNADGFSWLVVGKDATQDDPWRLPQQQQQEQHTTTPGAAAQDHVVSPPPPPPPRSDDSVVATTAGTTSQNILAAVEEEHDDNDDDDNNVCVICLDTFCEGDRLRVLPCGHLFHIGCIDRWLSGSLSTLDCNTSGCPTCKKSPKVSSSSSPSSPLSTTTTSTTMVVDAADAITTTTTSDDILSGSVPSWSFCLVGERLAQQDLQQQQ